VTVTNRANRTSRRRGRRVERRSSPRSRSPVRLAGRARSPRRRRVRALGVTRGSRRLESEEAVLTHELDPGMLFHQRLYGRQQLIDVVARPSASAMMKFACFSDTTAVRFASLAAGRFDQASGVVVVGLRNALPALAHPVGVPSPTHDLSDSLLGRFAVTGAKVQSHRDHQSSPRRRSCDSRSPAAPWTRTRDAVVPDRHRDQ